MKMCSVANCHKPACLRGWCNAHYLRWRRHGDPLGGGTSRGEASRYLADVVLSYDGDDCLAWPYSKDGNGYGQLRINGRVQYVTRIVCEHTEGPAPTPEHEAAHSCGKGHEGCCNPHHLRWATRLENRADMRAHGTHLRGERQNGAKLKEADVHEIRGLLRGGLSQREIASRFGVDSETIGHIKRGTNWAWLESAA